MERHVISPAPSYDIDEVSPVAGTGAKGTNLLKAVLRHRDLFEVWRPLARKFMSEGRLTARHRELVILRVACVLGSTYEWGNHVRVAGRAGCTDEEIARVRDEPTSPAWTTFEAALLAAPEQLLRTGTVADDAWADLAAELDDERLVELLLLIGHYAGIAFVANAGGVPDEPGLSGFEHPPPTT